MIVNRNAAGNERLSFIVPVGEHLEGLYNISTVNTYSLCQNDERGQALYGSYLRDAVPYLRNGYWNREEKSALDRIEIQ